MQLSLSSEAIDAQLAYLEQLQKWNRVYNLTAVRQPREMVGRHLLDSLSLLPHLDGDSLIDVGTGAGLPGIPLALARPDLRVTLLDASAKRTRFLQHLKTCLPLAQVTVVRARVEEHQPNAPYAMVTSRAFTELGGFLELTSQLSDENGCWLPMLGRRPDGEGLPPGFEISDLHRVSLPGQVGERHIARVVQRNMAQSG